MVLLSIITPAYNSAAWLASCIEHVAEQQCSQLEHIIVDGGSQDGSVEILEKLALKYPHLRWISEPDNGQSQAMNKGLALAGGKWIGFLNADDFYEPAALISVLEIIRKNPEELVLLTGNLRVLNEHDQLISLNKPSSVNLPALLADVCEWPYNPSAYFYPLRIHEKTGFFPEDEHFAMDYDFFFRLLLAGIPIRYIPQTWGNFRMQPEAKTVKDQSGSSSYLRAAGIRKKYLLKSPANVQMYARMLVSLWAIRNKFLGLLRKMNLVK